MQELRQGGIAVTIAKYETPLHNNINKVLWGAVQCSAVYYDSTVLYCIIFDFDVCIRVCRVV